MAAGANPCDNPAFNGVSAALAAGAAVNSNPVNPGMTHIPSPGISTDWTTEEQIALEEGIAKYSGVSAVVRYAKIALTLPNKTVRDVALRCRHMNKKEISKRRKEEPSRKSKDKREKVTEPSSKPSHLPSLPSNHPYPAPPVSIDDDGVSYKAIGGPIGELLEINVQAFHKISANFSSYKFQENINLFFQARDNIVKILNSCSLNDTPEIMKQMPPFPMKLNEDLVDSISRFSQARTV